MPKIPIKKVHMKKDMGIRIYRFEKSLKVESRYRGHIYSAEKGFVYNINNQIIGWNVRDLDEFWKPYISRIWTNGFNLPIGSFTTIKVERR